MFVFSVLFAFLAFFQQLERICYLCTVCLRCFILLFWLIFFLIFGHFEDFDEIVTNLLNIINWLYISTLYVPLVIFQWFWKHFLESKFNSTIGKTSKTEIQPTIEQINVSPIPVLKFSNELVLRILDRIPIRDLVCTVPRICTRFAALSKIACRRRRSIELLFGAQNYNDYRFLVQNLLHNVSLASRTPSSIDGLKFSSISQLNFTLSNKLVYTFPNIRSLKLSLPGMNSLQFQLSIIEILLTDWQLQIESFNLAVNFDYTRMPMLEDDRIGQDNLSTSVLQRLVLQLNRMPHLRRLKLCTTSKFGHFELPIIGQLRELYICSHDDVKIAHLTESLIKYGAKSEKLDRVEFGMFIPVDDNLIRNINTMENRAFASKITHLQLDTFVGTEIGPIKNLDSLFRHLTNLNRLSVSWNAHRPLQQLFRALVPLANDSTGCKLTYLGLKIFPQSELIEHTYDTSPMDLSELVSSNDFIPLRSIRKFVFMYSTFSHKIYGLFRFDAIFPNLESFHCYNLMSKCVTCGYDFGDYYYEGVWFRLVKRPDCIKLISEHLKRIRSKPQIKFTYYSYFMYDYVDLEF